MTMFARSFRHRDGGASSSHRESAMMLDSQYRIDKSARSAKLSKKGAGSVRDPQKLARLQRSLNGEKASRVELPQQQHQHARQSQDTLAPSPIVTMMIGAEGRLFAAHEDVLRQSPFFDQVLRSVALDGQTKRISLPEEEPEVFSAVLEYLYKGDYSPRLLHNKRRDSWELEGSRPPQSVASRLVTPNSSPAVRDSPRFDNSPRFSAPPGSPATVVSTASAAAPVAVHATVSLSSVADHVLRDTVIYCAAGRYGLEELKRLALRKQGLQAGIDVGTVLRSAQYCYAHTLDSDSRMRAHYLALIIRSRSIFKRSGTMQAEMEKCGSSGPFGEAGGKLFFDLFVAMCNHLDDVIDVGNARSPRIV